MEDRVPNENEFRLLDALASGEIAPDDARATLVRRNRMLRAMLRAMRNVHADTRRGPWHPERGWMAFEIRNQRGSEHPSTRPSIRGRDGFLSHRTVRIAGMTLATAALSAVLVTLWNGARSAPQPMAMREVQTKTGQRIAVQLVDGTMVTVGPNSHLRIPEGYGSQSRNLSLEGSALFEIAHNVERPFSLQAGRVQVRVLGTRFVVRAYDTTSVAVAVSEGKVGMTLDGGEAEAIVSAGHVGRMSSSGATSVSQKDLERLQAWVEGRLVFNETPLQDVLDDLGRWYGVSFVVTDSRLFEHTVTADWTDVSLSHVLMVLSTLLQIHVEQTGNEVVVSAVVGSAAELEGYKEEK